MPSETALTCDVGETMTHGKRGPLEHDVQTQIMDWLKLKHFFHFRSNAGAMVGTYKGKRRFVKFGPKGGPDIFVVIRGQIIGIEVKGEHGFQSQVQKEFEVEFTRAGGKYLLCFSLEDAIRGLNGKGGSQ